MVNSIFRRLRSCLALLLVGMSLNALAISAPSITSCTRASSTSVSLTWTSVSGAAYYVVRRSYSSSVGSSSSIATPSGTSYTDSFAGADTCYYWVEAWDNSGASARSGMATASSGSGGGGGGSGGSFTISATKGTSTTGCTITWSAQSGATGYRVVRGTTSNLDNANILVETVTGTSYTDTTGTAGKTYYYWIVAKKSSGYVTSSYATGYKASSSGGGGGDSGGGTTSISAGDPYTVAFNANGGSGTMAKESFVYGTAKALTINNFTRTGYTFSGWSKKSSATSPEYTNGQSVKNLATTSGETVTLYAVWRVACEVTAVTARQRYPWNGLVDIDVTFCAAGLCTVSFEVKDAEGNTNLNARTFYLGNPEKNVKTLAVKPGSYRFVWDAAADLGAVLIPFFSVTAKVKENIFNVNVSGGTGSGSFFQGTSVTLTAPSKTGYTFVCWSGTSADISLLASATSATTTFTIPSHDVTYTATYTPNTYTVKFYANGGTGTMANESFTYDTAKALTANAFKLNGWTFLGWDDSASATTVKYTDKQSVKNLLTSGTKNLYAVWGNPENGVQLWANGPYWAKCNVGATKPEGPGYYFWWGDTVGYKLVGSSWNAADGSVTGFTFPIDGCPTVNKFLSELKSAGYVDSNYRLVPAYDAASKNWGLPWRMPKITEFEALWDNTTWTKTTVNGVSGIRFTGKGNYASKNIFIPILGYVSGKDLNQYYAIRCSYPKDHMDVYPITWCSNIGNKGDFSFTAPAVFWYGYTVMQAEGNNYSEIGWDYGGYGALSGPCAANGLQIRPVANANK